MELGVLLRRIAPWWMRLGGKLLLSRVGLSYQNWKRLGLCAHGRMDEPVVALENFRTHFALAGFREGEVRDGGPFVVVELGPGDSLYTGVVAWAHGASSTYLIDDGEFATKEIDGLRAMATFLVRSGIAARGFEECATVEEALQKCSTQYLTEGIQSLRALQSGSVDFLFSNAVLEHVRKHQLGELLAEARRVVKQTGCCSHRVDLKDHMGGALNNLRFSDTFWESSVVASAGLYTNRVRFREMLKMFEDAGFSVDVRRTLRWDVLPTRRERLAERFRALEEEDLLTYGFDAVLRPR